MPESTIFLKLVVRQRPVPGDVRVPGYEQQIALQTCHWSTHAEHRSVGQDARTTLQHGHLRLSKVFDRSSTALYGYMRENEKVDSASITMVDPGIQTGNPLPMLELNFFDCYIDRLSARASDGGSVVWVTENFMLSFSTGVLRFYPENPVAPGRLAPTEYRIPKSRTRD